MGEDATKNSRMMQYLAKAKELLTKFGRYKLHQIGHNNNTYTNAFSNIGDDAKIRIKENNSCGDLG